MPSQDSNPSSPASSGPSSQPEATPTPQEAAKSTESPSGDASVSHKSHINIDVELNERRIPTKIRWQADEDTPVQVHDTKALLLATWDEKKVQALRLELWTPALQTDEMKRFYIDLLGGMSQGILQSTGDAFMSQRIEHLCKELAVYHQNELEQQAKASQPPADASQNPNQPPADASQNPNQPPNQAQQG